MQNKRKIDIVFVVIAKRDAPFYANIADELMKSGYTIGFISFYEPAYDLLASNERVVWHPFKKVESEALDIDVESEYVFTLNDFIRHEQVTSFVDVRQLRSRASTYIESLKTFFTLHKVELVVQEIGGFVGNLSVYYAARKCSVPHMFIEPSFFKNRAFFFLNSMGPYRVNLYDVNNQEKVTEDDAIEYIHHYSSPFSKVLNRRNWDAFFSKIIDIYFSKKHVEFGYPLRKATVQLRYFMNYWQLRAVNRYESLDTVKSKGKIVYFPLHVPDDFQLTVRSPEFHNQVELINFIASNLPQGYRLATKEHPAMKGSLSPRDIKRFIVYDNVSIIEPSTNNYQILKECDLVITVNSKSGFEGVLHHKPVITLSDTFYTGYGLTIDIHSLDELRKVLYTLRSEKPDIKISLSDDKITSFVSELYRNTYWQNLYVNDRENIQRCAKEIARYFESNCGSKSESNLV